MRRLRISIAFLLLHLHALPQEVKWWCSSDIGNLALRHANIRMHRQTGSWDLGLRLDYRPAIGHGWIATPAGSSYAYSNFRNWNYQGIGLGSIARLNFGHERRMFIEADAVYRLWWLNRKWITYDNAESYSFSGLRTERHHVAAIRLLWGGRGRSIPIGNRKALCSEGLIGLGFRWKQMRYVTHDGVIGRPDFARACVECTEQEHLFTPSVHITLRVAVVSNPKQARASD